MKIGIDARLLYSAVRKGMGVYLTNLIAELQAIDPQNEYVLYYDSRQPAAAHLAFQRNFQARGIAIRKGDTFYLWEQLCLPAAVAKDKLDLFHSPTNTSMLRSATPRIVTIHDTIIQETAKPRLRQRLYFDMLQPMALRRAGLVLTDSEYSKERINAVLRVPKAKIRVIPCGVSSAFQPIEDKGKGDFILSVGGESPWKNVSRLIEAYALARRDAHIDLRLVITGIRAPAIVAQCRRQLARLGIEETVIILGYVSDEELVTLYNAARIFIYPSLKEGFGLPPLEAMACGTPVAASSATAIPEVVGDAALLFDGTKTEDISAALCQLLGDCTLQEELRKKGLARAAGFSWRATAEKTLQAYQEVHAAGLRRTITAVSSAPARKTILFYEDSSGFGGSAAALANITGHLDRKRFCPLIVLTHHGAQTQQIKNTEIIRLGRFAKPIAIYRLIKSRNVDLVHVNNNILSGIPAIIAAKLAGVPCICHIRQTRKLIRRERWFTHWINRFILINQTAHETYLKDIPVGKTSVVYDGIAVGNTVALSTGTFRREFHADSQPLVGLIGRVVEGKGQREFVAAAEEVLSRMPQARFFIVGDAKGGSNHYLATVKEAIRRANLSQQVILTGWRNDIPQLIADLDILVQASSSFPEGFGLTIIEAMAAQKPVVATAIPGPTEIVVPGKTGLLVPAGNSHALAAALLELLTDPQRARQMGIAGRKRVEELFTIQKTVSQIEAIYANLLPN